MENVIRENKLSTKSTHVDRKRDVKMKTRQTLSNKTKPKSLFAFVQYKMVSVFYYVFRAAVAALKVPSLVVNNELELQTESRQTMHDPTTMNFQQ